MNNEITFGRWEGICLLITMISTKAILDFPRIMVEGAGVAGWILSVYISVLALIGFWIINKLYRGFSGKDILDIGESLGGKPLKIILGTVIWIFIMLMMTVSLRLFGELIKSMGFDISPPSFLMLFFFAGVLFGAYVGIEAIVRFMAILVPVSVISFTIFIVALMPLSDINNIFPLLGNGAYEIFVKGSLKLSCFSELLFLFLIVPFLKTQENFKKSGFIAILLSAVVFLSITLLFITIYPPPVGREEILPAYQLGRTIEYGRFFKRLESILIITWSTIGFMYLSTIFFFSAYVFKKTFNLKYYRPLLLPFGVISFSFSMIPERLMNVTEFQAKYYRNWGWTVTFGLVILLLAFANKKKHKNQHI